MLFVQKFDPFRGDVLYGLTASRTTYLEKWMDYQSRTSIDEKYRNFNINNRYFYINDYNEPITRGNFDDLEKVQLDQNRDKTQTQWLDALENTRYSPYRLNEAKLARLLESGDQRFKQNWRLKPTPEEMATLAMVYAVRRACKYGIWYIVFKHTSGYLHYVLDGINMHDVAKRNSQMLWTGTVGVPITTSELRFVFRHWHQFRDRPHFIFWRDFRDVPAPWDEHPGAWMGYAWHSMKKRKMDKKYLDAFRSAAAQRENRKAIRIFHDALAAM